MKTDDQQRPERLKESIVAIDELSLDKECIRLPTQYLQAAHNSAQAKRDQNEAKSQLDVVHAELGSAIRQSPEKYGLDKVTESSITATILAQKSYKQARQAFDQACYEAEMAQALVWAMEHKKRALTLLVDLHGMGYSSNVKMSSAGKQAVEEMTKKAVHRRIRGETED